jgi:hypothetical protein
MANTHATLAEIVATVGCKPGWSFRLQTDSDSGDIYPKLVIIVPGFDSARPGELVPMTVSHFFPVPEATYNAASWRRWIFECCRGVENHELGEWFRIGADRPFAPLHGPGEDPYRVHEFRPAADALTTQDGTLRAPYGP